MNFLSEILFGTPHEKAPRPVEEHHEDDDAPRVQVDDDEEEEERATMPPRRSMSRQNRSRSLSRVYNQVPRGRPTARQAQMDLCEYYAHLAMMETDADRVKIEDEHLRQALQGCKPRLFGRLFSRIQITALCISIGALAAPVVVDDEDEQEPVYQSAALWHQLHRQIKVVKECLLRKDANIFVPVEREGYDDDDNNLLENEALDTELEKHAMFQEAYREVLVLLKVQEILATLCEQLDKNEKDAKQTYTTALTHLFAQVGAVPAELTAFLDTDDQAVIFKAALELMADEESVYSYAQLKSKMRAVLTKWSESILEIPKLIQLGYGGVMSILNAEEDDVSSYGVDEDQLLTQKPLPEESSPPDTRNRRTSFADERQFPSKSPRSNVVVQPSFRNLPTKAPRSQAKKPPNGEKDDDDDEEEEDNEESTTPDSYETPEKRKRHENGTDQEDKEKKPSTPKRRRSKAPDDDMWEDLGDEPKMPRTYLDWTEDETNAVREGYAKFGKKWAMIKHNSQHRLIRRTNVQIKDKFRTMLKRGEIQETAVC